MPRQSPAAQKRKFCICPERRHQQMLLRRSVRRFQYFLLQEPGRSHSSALHRVIFALQDLLADASPGAPAQQTTGPAAITNQPFTNREVLQAADFKNLHFLNAFVSDGGQILSRNKTKLQAKVHRHLARQIKTARIMALLPHSGGQLRALHYFEVNLIILAALDFFSFYVPYSICSCPGVPHAP